MAPVAVDDRCDLSLQPRLWPTRKLPCSARRKESETVDHLRAEIILASEHFIEITYFRQYPAVIRDQSVGVSLLGSGGHLRPGRVERVVREGCIVELISSDRQTILLAILTYNSAPQVEIFVLIIVEVRLSPPFNIIMSGVEVQFEFYTVFRKRLGKITD
jgi:hypothetical protein